MDLQALSDQLELQRLITVYAHALDERNFTRLDEVFTPDAQIDYTAMGGIAGDWPRIRRWLPEAMKPFPAYMHLMGNCLFDVTGDVASGKIACFNPMVVSTPEGAEQVMFLGLWYADRYARTPAGWRISERVERRGYMHGMPEWMRKALQVS